MRKYDSIQLIGDILTGISFVTGSILNLTGAPSMYGQILYLIGSLALTVHPTIKIIRRTKINRNTS
ncbi:YrhK family protein [Oceanobacillus alkalisoli]|uniref:YrhK family protein n=1 Tax=Oceanobacillus alkalisoli TaxID=2925113 RepID=UPI0034E2AE6F